MNRVNSRKLRLFSRTSPRAGPAPASMRFCPCRSPVRSGRPPPIGIAISLGLATCGRSQARAQQQRLEGVAARPIPKNLKSAARAYLSRSHGWLKWPMCRATLPTLLCASCATRSGSQRGITRSKCATLLLSVPSLMKKIEHAPRAESPMTILRTNKEAALSQAQRHLWQI
jgi:hypothetical protein